MGRQRTDPALMDALRVRALRGDKLTDLRDAQREWVWRSLLKGVRRWETQDRGHLSDEQYERGVERVRRWYAARIAAYKAHQAEAGAVQVVRPVKGVARPRRKGIWFFLRGQY